MPEKEFRPYICAGVSYVLIPDKDSGPVAIDIDYDNGKLGFTPHPDCDYFWLFDVLCGFDF